MAKASLYQGASLCVVGNINRDVKCAPLAPSTNLFRDGETSVEWIAETIGGGEREQCAGGGIFGRARPFCR